jgi:ATP/maltotriose-dependent transcriptional regulator MalT
MLKAALLQELAPEACRWIFQALDAAAQLEALEADHLVQRLGDGTTYRYPTYLQEFLTAEGKRTISAIAFKDWHRRAANYYQDGGREELALPHLIASEDWAGALWACDMSFPAMRFTGRQKQIERWLALFPDALADTEPRLALWQGHVKSRGGAISESLVCYDRALELFKDQSDTRGEFKVLVRLFTLALVQDDAPKAAKLMPETLSRVAFGDPEDVVDLHLARALAADRRGDMALVRECNEEALALPFGESIEIAASHYIARSNLYTLALHKGHLREALRHIERALEIAGAWNFYPYHLVASFLRADLHLTEGAVEEAGRFLKALPSYWVEILDWHDLACAYAVLGGYHQARGEWKEAEDVLRKSLAIFTEAEYDIGKKVPLERLMWLALARKQYTRAEELKAESGDVDLNNIYDLALRVPYARALHLGGRAESAIAELETLIPAIEAIDAPLHLSRAHLFEAAARRKAGDARAKEALDRALALIEQNGYTFLLETDQTLWEE